MKFKIDFKGVEDLKIDKLEISSCKKEKLKKENTIQNDRINLEENVPWENVEENAEWKNIGKILKKPLSVAIIILIILILLLVWKLFF